MGMFIIRGPGYTFGLGFGIVSDAGENHDPLTPGTFTWGGAWGTIFWVDPVEEMIGINDDSNNIIQAFVS